MASGSTHSHFTDGILLCGLLRQPIYLALHQLPIETFVAHEKIR
jgi:hypothetical protein